MNLTNIGSRLFPFRLPLAPGLPAGPTSPVHSAHSGRGRPVEQERWFYRSDDEWIALVERLKLTAYRIAEPPTPSFGTAPSSGSTMPTRPAKPNGRVASFAAIATDRPDADELSPGCRSPHSRRSLSAYATPIPRKTADNATALRGRRCVRVKSPVPHHPEEPMKRPVAWGSFTPRLSRNRTGDSRLIRLLRSSRRSNPNLPGNEQIWIASC